MRTAACLLALLVATSATAQTIEGILPPVKYDRPFAGKLTVFTAKDQAQVRTMCPNTKFPPIGALGCALFGDGKHCTVVLAPDADIVAAGFTTEIAKRHEIGHCNGWSAAHEGSRAYEEWAETPWIRVGEPVIPFRIDALDKILFGR